MTRKISKPTVDQGVIFAAFNVSTSRGRKGCTWTFKHFCEACDTPGANRVQAVLVASNATGFVLYARQNSYLHHITQNDFPVIFRTIEQTLDTLADVPHLRPEIAIDITSW